MLEEVRVSKNLTTMLAAVIAALLGLASAAYLLSAPTPPTEFHSGTLFKQPRPLPDFSLQASDGSAYTRERLQGRWSLVFPGFTYCPDICPTTLALLKRLNDGLDKRLNIVFLSVDPERDTPERLRTYLANFDPDFIGITAAEPQLQQLASAMGISYLKSDGATPESYSMDHSAGLMLVNPRGELAAYLSPPHELDAMITDLRGLLDATP